MDTLREAIDNVVCDHLVKAVAGTFDIDTGNFVFSSDDIREIEVTRLIDDIMMTIRAHAA